MALSLFDQEMTDFEKNNRDREMINYVTRKLGKTKITDTEIICNINRRKLDKYLIINNDTLKLVGFNNGEFVSDEYDIFGKPIRYIIEDKEFSSLPIRTVGNTIVEFNNCHFSYFPELIFIDNIVFNNCTFDLKYNSPITIMNKDKQFINNVLISNCKINTIDHDNLEGCFIALVKHLKIIDSTISCGSYIINSDDISICSTRLKANDSLKINSKKLLFDHININVSKILIDSEDVKIAKVNLNSLNVDISGHILSTQDLYCSKGIIIYNGISLVKYNNININLEYFNLLRERAIVANVLYKMNYNIENQINNKVNNYTRRLKMKSISDSLIDS